jgi:hypothetical protein
MAKGCCTYVIDLHSMCILSTFHSESFQYGIEAIFLPSDRWIALADGNKITIWEHLSQVHVHEQYLPGLFFPSIFMLVLTMA